MPRRYRPPTRRRKSKKQSPSQEMATRSYQDGAAPALSQRPTSAPTQAARGRSSQIRHIARDHSYIRAEVRLIALLTAFIVAGLVITAILR